MRARDADLREELARTGALFDGYHPRMAALHRAHAARLADLVEAAGWPGSAQVGSDAAEAAWLVVQHAVDQPHFQRGMLALLSRAASAGEVPAWQPAYLEDRIRALEGRPQRYGTQLDWDEAGEMSLWPPVEDPERVDARRAEVGLPPLAPEMERRRDAARRGSEPVPADPAARRREMDAWARRVGWRPAGEPVADAGAPIGTRRLELVPAVTESVRAALEGHDALGEALRAVVPADWPPEHVDADALQFTLDRLAEGGEQAGWWMHFVVLTRPERVPRPRTVVGTAGYCGPPSEDGSVEIGYSIVPSHRRRRYATEAAHGMIDRAFSDPRVGRVIAETLPDLLPSIAVLRACGFEPAEGASGPGIVRYALTRAARVGAGGTREPLPTGS